MIRRIAFRRMKRRCATPRACSRLAGVLHLCACAAPRSRSPGTWITPEMRAAYCLLHARGWAHSYEIWREGTLIGGLYGVRLGPVFFGESMFSREADASKGSLAGLVARSEALGIELIDCQLPSAHLRSLGSRPIPRSEFLAVLAAGALGSAT